MTAFIDTHCHIDTTARKMKQSPADVLPYFFEAYSLENTKKTAKEPIVNTSGQCLHLVHSACETESIARLDEILALDERISICAGIHPHDAVDYNEAIERELLEWMKHPRCVAWGEMGLDYFYDHSPRDLQKKVFAQQAKQAVALHKPLVIHSRDAEADTLDILGQVLNEDSKTHIHCFTADKDYALELLKLPGDVFIGFTGALTFNNSDSIRDAAANIPLTQLLLETDAPFMAPVPFRGQTAVSAMIPQIAQVLAELHQVELSDLYAQILENTQRMYGKMHGIEKTP
jgi:TatD DNase family protein